MITSTAAYLSDPRSSREVRKKGKGGVFLLFRNATHQEILTMLAYKSITPHMRADGRIQYWVLNCSASRMKLTLKAQRGRIDAEANHTVAKATGGYQHVMRICAAYA